MDIALIKILTNVGLFILIWIVQLLIYPSFILYTETNLKKWHKQYTQRVTFIVMPLMLAQLFLYGYSAFFNYNVIDLVLFILVLVIWGHTFLIAVPLHSRLENDADTIPARKKLVKTNWIRTISWTMILILSLIIYAK